MTKLDDIKAAIRADILARREPFTFNQAVNDARMKYGERDGSSIYRIVDTQIQMLRKKCIISTHREGRLQLWTVLPT